MRPHPSNDLKLMINRFGGEPAAGAAPAVERVTSLDWSAVGERDHLVQFYESTGALVSSLAEFIAAGLDAGEACIVFATAEHRAAVETHLLLAGRDLAAPRRAGTYVARDAAATLAAITVDGEIDPARFFDVAGGLVADAARLGRRVRVYGEIVALLWNDGRHAIAHALEELWNDLGRTRSFCLLCGYPVDLCSGDERAADFAAVCAAHTHTVPTPTFTSLATRDDQLRAVAVLQRQAASLSAEIARRKEAEKTVRALLRISGSLNSTLDLDELLDVLVIEAIALVGAESGVAGLRSADGMFCRRYHRDGEWLPLEYVWPEGHGLPGWLIEHRRPYMTNDAASDPQIVQELCAQFGVTEALSTPVLDSRGGIIGFFEIHNTRDRSGFTQAHIDHLAAVAQVAAVAVQNALAYRAVHQAEEDRAGLLEREQAARLRAEEASRLKDEFLATVSHELRTPLNAIIGWTHLLASGGLDEESAAHAVATIARNAKSQAQLVEDLLDVSRIIAGQLRLSTAPVDIAAVINAAVDSVELAAEAREIALSVTLDASARHTTGDAARLQQVVWNLLSNAIRFTPPKGRVEIRLERVDDALRIVVSDTGEGIDPTFLPIIFDHFRQADGTSTRRHGGLGLGLSIVRHLVELHGGTVHAASDGPGHGATFTIRLPRVRATLATRSANRTASPGAIDGATEPTASLGGISVLVVDDHDDARTVLASILTDRHAIVETAASAEDAIDRLRRFLPAVLVCDLAMPGEDGYELIAHVRALEAERSVRIAALALTAHVRVEDRIRALAAGFDMFVPKPFDPNELVAAIAGLAEHRA